MPAGALLATAAIAQLSLVEEAQTTTKPPRQGPTGVAVATPDEPSIAPVVGEESEATAIVLAEAEDWTPQLERRFLRLAERNAVDELRADEAKEYGRLLSLRNRLQVPRSGEEVLREYEQRKLTNDLLIALQRYVQFHTGTNRPKA